MNEKDISGLVKDWFTKVDNKITTNAVAKQFILEEIEGASFGNEKSQRFAELSGFNKAEYTGAMTDNSFDEVDGVDSPQQILMFDCHLPLRNRIDNDILIDVRFQVVDKIMKKYSLGKYSFQNMRLSLKSLDSNSYIFIDKHKEYLIYDSNEFEEVSDRKYYSQKIRLYIEINDNLVTLEPQYKTKSSFEIINEEKLLNKVVITTEGKTDWKHLKKALNRFQGKGIYLNLNIKFDEYENRGAGEASLENQLKAYASDKQEKKIIGIFDRDTKKYVKEYGKQEFVKVLDRDYENRLKEKIEKYYSDKSSPKYKSFEQNLESGNYSEIEEDIKKALTGHEYNEWKKLSENNVYAFCIPEIQDSDSPRKLDAICIEFYYKEKDLKTTTKDGKRLFFADEFKVNQEHRDKSERFISKCGKFKTESVKVKEGAKKELTLISTPVYNDENKDILLSKNDFTNHIINDVEGFNDFEIENFKLIFDVIEKIIYDV